ncbi:hypothetical protein [Actinomycetospora sp. TBRC 11914]|uniref:hypothetical protein n=1 Tax=Actinomycetospora sp. TBRC 11914 TaxID=2729387 RepID=UPI00145FBE42|nr:hypothetical protein [Actinomycetospora sp. TBRC 11914]NMO88179.1 hypothetical protein [Actinomycetospora sp. TBRC 11914]
MLLDPISTRLDTAVPAAPAPDSPITPMTVLPDAPAPEAPAAPAPELPADLAPLVSRARRERGSALALVHLLLERGWTATEVGAALDGEIGLTRTQIEALATVRRPRTSASDVADRLVASRRPLARVPHQRRP